MVYGFEILNSMEVFTISSEKLGILLPIKAEQIERLNEDKDFKYTKASRHFNFSPITFKKGIKLEVDNYLEKN